MSRHVRLTFVQRNLLFSHKTTVTTSTDGRNSMGKTHQSWTLLTQVQYLLILLGDPAVHHGLSSPSAFLDSFSKVHFLFLTSSSLLVNDQNKSAWTRKIWIFFQNFYTELLVLFHHPVSIGKIMRILGKKHCFVLLVISQWTFFMDLAKLNQQEKMSLTCWTTELNPSSWSIQPDLSLCLHLHLSVHLMLCQIKYFRKGSDQHQLFAILDDFYCTWHSYLIRWLPISLQFFNFSYKMDEHSNFLSSSEEELRKTA